MKKSTKILASAVAALAIFFSVNANAQDSRKFGIGLNAGAGVGTGQSFAIGGDLRYQLDVAKQLSIPITAGYTNIQYKDEYGDISFGYIPVKAGLKYFFNDSGAGAYGLAEAGAAFGVGDNSGTAFVFSPAIGYSWSNGLDLAAKYEGLSDNGATGGYVGLRLAYGFKL
jgi:hypothetical protein